MVDGRLLLVGNPAEVHVGSHLRRAAEALGIATKLYDSTTAFAAPAWRRKVEWWARGRRPARLREFSAAVVAAVEQWKPRWLVTTGISPVDAAALSSIGSLGVTRMNMLTDDPWNPAHRAPWFMDALTSYDHVFTPRRRNLPDLQAHCGRVSYLPFAYAPDVHFPQPPASDADRRRFDADVMFAGGADPDRVRLLGSLIRAGLRVALYGGYWDRFPETRDYARGMLAAAELRMATAAAKVCVCLVRRANRDGHSMRSYEIPAMRGCVLAEDTDDHRALFGSDGAAAVLFSDVDDAVDRVRRLASDANRCAALAEAAHRRITSGGETYADRLTLMIRVAEDGESVPSAPAMSASQ